MRSNVINPGYGLRRAGVWSPELRASRAVARVVPPERLEEFYAVAILHVKIRPEGAAGVAVFLLSDRSSRTTGRVITVEGHRDRVPTVNRYLLIGGAGLIGSYLREAIPTSELSVTYREEPVPGGLQLDVRDERALSEIIEKLRPSVIVLAAADPFVEACERDPGRTREVNVDPARVIAELAARAGSLFVVFSSEYVFDGANGPYIEDGATQPINEYGRQKVELETIARTAPRHLICRTSGVFGWHPRRRNFVCQLIDRLRSGHTFDVPSDQVITPTYAPDLANCVRKLIESGTVGTIHVAGPLVVDRLEFAHMAARAFQLPPALIRARPTVELGLMAARPRNAGLSDAKLRGLTGPLMSPVDALRKMAGTEK